MATLVQQPSGNYTIRFRYDEVQFNRSLETGSENKARAEKACIEETFDLLKRGRLSLPEGTTPDQAWNFFRSGGRQISLPKLAQMIPLKRVWSDYFESYPDGAKEPNSLKTERVHSRHFEKHLGANTAMMVIGTRELESYVKNRQKERGLRGNTVQAKTIIMELQTFRLLWEFARSRGYVSTPNPVDSARKPMSDDKEPFQTYEEIVARIKRGNLDESQRFKIWECLFLRESEITQVLTHVEKNAEQGFVYPMFAFVAFTGVRRSEMMRSEISDVRLKSGKVLVREKKKSKSRKITFREVDLHKKLKPLLAKWLKNHSGGNFTFAKDDGTPLTEKEAVGFFNRALRGSKWTVLRGFHVFRHSFASNCALRGIHQSLINAWMGHTSEAMQRRYRHLFPEETRSAIDRLF